VPLCTYACGGAEFLSSAHSVPVADHPLSNPRALPMLCGSCKCRRFPEGRMTDPYSSIYPLKQSVLMAEMVHAKAGIVVLPHAQPPTVNLPEPIPVLGTNTATSSNTDNITTSSSSATSAERARVAVPPSDVTREYAPSLVRVLLKTMAKMKKIERRPAPAPATAALAHTPKKPTPRLLPGQDRHHPLPPSSRPPVSVRPSGDSRSGGVDVATSSERRPKTPKTPSTTRFARDLQMRMEVASFEADLNRDNGGSSTGGAASITDPSILSEIQAFILQRRKGEGDLLPPK
jgi:hypothetical protein